MGAVQESAEQPAASPAEPLSGTIGETAGTMQPPADQTLEGTPQTTTEPVAPAIEPSHEAIASLVLCPRLDLEAAGVALKSGARGFLHAGMAPEQLARAIEVASRGELAFLRGLLEFLIGKEEAPASSLDGLSARQREILGLVAEGLNKAQIGRTLFLSESTVKQHLRAAYKALGVKNRSQAARIFRRSGASGGGWSRTRPGGG